MYYTFLFKTSSKAMILKKSSTGNKWLLLSNVHCMKLKFRKGPNGLRNYQH